MNVLFVGSGKGSWTMRGEQIGAALDARVRTAPLPDDWRWADVVVLVKRAALAFAPFAHRAGVPIVWDALDFWMQPSQNSLSETEAIALLHRQMAVIRPALTIGATEAMARAADGVCIPHHPRLDLQPTPARNEVHCVGYDGNPFYLDRWRVTIERECARRGWQFVMNPTRLSDMDILIALRGGQWDGWMCRAWKSGVKAVNAIAAGRPLISQDAASIREIAPDGVVIERIEELSDAFDAVSGRDRRRQIAERSLCSAPRFSVDAIAEQYRACLSTVAGRKAVAC